jgi:hypothetical protein
MTHFDRPICIFWGVLGAKNLVIQTLMRALGVVVGHVLFDRVFNRGFTYRTKVLQAL